MDKIWNITIEFLAKINMLIPLVSILWAGIGLVGIVLILAITGCALRKRLVPQWLIWGYFIFASIIIFAQADNDIFKVVAYIEVPFLVVLLCYFLRMLFYRRPRYTYMERTVQVREIDKNRAANKKVEEVVVANEVQSSVLSEDEDDEDNSELNIDETIVENKEEAVETVIEEKKDVEIEEASDNLVEKNETNVFEAEENKNTEVETEEVVEQVKEAPVAAMDLPVVEPIPEKTYEAPREPDIVATPVSETIPNLTTTPRPTTTARSASSTAATLNRTSATSSSLFGNRTSATTTARPTTTTTTTTTTTARPTLSSYSSILNSRKPATTSTTTTTTSTTRTTSGLGSSATTKTRSTDEIMAAIERLRASMKK